MTARLDRCLSGGFTSPATPHVHPSPRKPLPLCPIACPCLIRGEAGDSDTQHTFSGATGREQGKSPCDPLSEEQVSRQAKKAQDGSGTMLWPGQGSRDTHGLPRPPIQGVTVSLRTCLAPWLCFPVYPPWAADDCCRCLTVPTS